MQDRVQLVRDLLALWRSTRHPDVADVLEGASQSVATARGGAIKRRSSKVDPTYREMAEARRPEDLGLLLPRALATMNSSESKTFLQLLRPWAPDPRLATFAHEWLTRPRTRGDSWRSFYGMIFELLADVSDPRSIPVLEEFSSATLIDYGEGLAKTSQTRAKKLATKIPPPTELDATSRRHVDEVAAELKVKLRPPPGPRPAHIDELARAALADIQDDVTLQVYSDALLSVGDPRGELIALQLARGDGPPTARESALLRKHGKTFAGPLSRVARSVEFTRGFPSRVTLGNTKFLAKTFGLPEWRWVREIDATALESYEADWLCQLLADPPAKGLPHLERIVDHVGTFERAGDGWKRVEPDLLA